MNDRCVCCEKPGEVGVTFSEGLTFGPVKKTVICMECLIIGARFIVNQARKQLDEETECEI